MTVVKCCLAGTLGVVALGVATSAQAPAAQAPAGGRGGVLSQEERPILRQFDKDGNKRLDAAERQAAREWLAAQPGGGRGGPFGGRGGGRGFAPASPGPRMAPSDVRPAGRSPLYDVATLRTVFLQFENADWEKELADFRRTDVDVPAAVTVDGKTYPDVGVHFRGMSSFFMVPESSKRSLNLGFDFAHANQRLLGYRTLNLLNAMGDPTFVRPVLYGEIARHYVPTPKSNYMRVVINGEYWGVYVNVQQFNGDFTREWFSSTKGARWKVPGSPFGQGGMEYLGDRADAYKRIYQIKSKDNDKAWTDLIRMFRVLNETPPERLEAALAPMLDVDGALKFLALEVALVNSDGYWARASDYSIYEDEKGRFHILPHDVNEGIAEEVVGGGRGGVGPGGARGGPPPGLPPGAVPPAGAPPGPGPGGFPAMFGRARVDLDPLIGLDDAKKPLRSKLLAVPALRARYLGYVHEIADRWLDWKTLEPLVRRYQAVIADGVKADTRKLYTFEAFQSGVREGEESLKTFVDRRRAFLFEKRRANP